MNAVVIIILIILFFGAVGTAPGWPHSANWGPWPSGGLGLLLFILLILWALGKI